MDQDRIADMKAMVTGMPSRRDVLRGLAALGIGLGTARLPAPVAATHFGCRHVGDRCKRVSQCCSGICTGKRGKKKCGAHDTGTCDQQVGGICDSGDPLRCNNSITCICLRTTAGSSICGENDTAVSGCADCQSDADCERQGFPAGSSCAPFANGVCAGTCPTGMVCMAPCGAKPIMAQRRDQADTTASSGRRRHPAGSAPLLPVPEPSNRGRD